MNNQEVINKIRAYLTLAHISVNGEKMEESDQVMRYKDFNKILEKVEDEMTLYDQKKVKDILGLLSYGTPWRLVGARTGKTLCTNTNTEKYRNKFLDKEVTDNPIFVDLDAPKSPCIGVPYVKPRICIWVLGE